MEWWFFFFDCLSKVREKAGKREDGVVMVVFMLGRSEGFDLWQARPYELVLLSLE